MSAERHPSSVPEVSKNDERQEELQREIDALKAEARALSAPAGTAPRPGIEPSGLSTSSAGCVSIPYGPLAVTPYILWQLLEFHGKGLVIVRTAEWNYACTIPPWFKEHAMECGKVCREADGRMALMKVRGAYDLMKCSLTGAVMFSDGVSMARVYEMSYKHADAWLEEESAARMRHFGESCSLSQ